VGSGFSRIFRGRRYEMERPWQATNARSRRSPGRGPWAVGRRREAGGGRLEAGGGRCAAGWSRLLKRQCSPDCVPGRLDAQQRRNGGRHVNRLHHRQAGPGAQAGPGGVEDAVQFAPEGSTPGDPKPSASPSRSGSNTARMTCAPFCGSRASSSAAAMARFTSPRSSSRTMPDFHQVPLIVTALGRPSRYTAFVLERSTVPSSPRWSRPACARIAFGYNLRPVPSAPWSETTRMTASAKRRRSRAT
jgi:hypothetical protein